MTEPRFAADASRSTGHRNAIDATPGDLDDLPSVECGPNGTVVQVFDGSLLLVLPPTPSVTHRGDVGPSDCIEPAHWIGGLVGVSEPAYGHDGGPFTGKPCRFSDAPDPLVDEPAFATGEAQADGRRLAPKVLTFEFREPVPTEKCVPSPWTEGAWIMATEDAPAEWEQRPRITDQWKVRGWGLGSIVEARPPQPPETITVSLGVEFATSIADPGASVTDGEILVFKNAVRAALDAAKASRTTR